MPIIPATWNAALLGELASGGMMGQDLPNMTNAIASGSAMGVIGKSFTTTDTGTMPGVGTGTGVGLTVVGSVIAAAVLASMTSAGMVGTGTVPLSQAIGNAAQQSLALATLSSNHPVVFLGAGVLTPGSIPVTGSSIKSSILSAAPFTGKSWSDLCQAIGDGMEQGMKTAVGQVVISGAFTGPVPPGPVPGAGTGSGVIV